jgi:hypothetical protein
MHPSNAEEDLSLQTLPLDGFLIGIGGTWAAWIMARRT